MENLILLSLYYIYGIKMKSKKYVKSIILILCLIFISSSGMANAIKHNSEGWDFYNKGQYRNATMSFKSALRLNAKYEEAIIGLAKTYYQTGIYNESLDLFSEVLKLNPNSVEALTGSAFVLIELGRYVPASQLFDRAFAISGENGEVNYGMAYLYYSMGNIVWAKRKIESILNLDPFHYDALLLLAEIKSREGRLNEARKIIEKAIKTNSELPQAYEKVAEILYADYVKTQNKDSLLEAKDSLKTAIAIDPQNYKANLFMGDMLFIEGKYDSALEFYEKTEAEMNNPTILYRMAVTSDRDDNKDKALEYFLNAYKKTPSDSVLKARIEDFLVKRDYKIASPARNIFNEGNYEIAQNKMRKNLPDEAIMYLRRTLMMNPMNKDARLALMDYYANYDYNDFFIAELKELVNLHPEKAFIDRLQVEIMKRRNRMYHLEGYSTEPIPRDVPRVLVLNLNPENSPIPHPDAGNVFSSHLTFTLGQFGRMQVTGLRDRELIVNLKTNSEALTTSFDIIDKLVASKQMEKPDFLIYGNYHENADTITVTLNVYDNNTGIIIGEFTLSESGREALQMLSLRMARRIYNIMPYRGKVLKQKENSVVVNLGSFDGVKPDDILVVNKYNNPSNPFRIKKKIAFTVKEVDTLLCIAEPNIIAELDEVDSTDYVYPINKRRSKKIN
jgi:tetratricopeptide (TPR) repeat protein